MIDKRPAALVKTVKKMQSYTIPIRREKVGPREVV